MDGAALSGVPTEPYLVWLEAGAVRAGRVGRSLTLLRPLAGSMVSVPAAGVSSSPSCPGLSSAIASTRDPCRRRREALRPDTPTARSVVPPFWLSGVCSSGYSVQRSLWLCTQAHMYLQGPRTKTMKTELRKCI